MNLCHFRQLACTASILAIAVATHGAQATTTEKVLYNFNVIGNGNYPQAPIVAGPNGVFYGTTNNGGVGGNGTVFELAPPASGQTAWTQKPIHAFMGPDGQTPDSSVLVGKDGVIYGVAADGGTADKGTVYMLTPPAAGKTAWTETTLYSFKGGDTDGQAPYGALVMDGKGVLYGSTNAGGTQGAGTVFSLTPPAKAGQPWTEKVLHIFAGGTDGANPAQGLVLNPAGALYGMTEGGGNPGAGTVFRVTPPTGTGKSWTKTTIYNFSGKDDGSFPYSGLALDKKGVIYGTTFGGGAYGSGVLFTLTPPAAGKTAFTLDVLHNFSGKADGGAPDATPVLAASGDIYVTTQGGGGPSGVGTVDVLAPPKGSDTNWAETTLIEFNQTDGTNPVGVTPGAGGALYGVTYGGGAVNGGGGIAYKLTPGPWKQTVLYRFPQQGKDAADPSAQLLRASNGKLYGTASQGGLYGDGAVFELTPPTGTETAWTETILHSFDGTDGQLVSGRLLEGKNGVLYGVASSGGVSTDLGGNGVVFALTPPAAGQKSWTEETIYAFKGVAKSDGAEPYAGLIDDASGALYGTTGSGGAATSSNSSGNGTVFKLTAPASGKGAWTEAVLHRFNGAGGSQPEGTLLLGAGGTLIGTTELGGAGGLGTVFRLIPPAKAGGAWTEALLYSFPKTALAGALPTYQQLVADGAGGFYGTANQGGANNDGVVFHLTPPAAGKTVWTGTVIHAFKGTDGSFPNAGLLAINGVLYGTAPGGGPDNYGTIYRLAPSASGGAWKFSVLHNFNPLYGSDGGAPQGALVKDANNDLYGTTNVGGHGQAGTVYEVLPGNGTSQP